MDGSLYHLAEKLSQKLNSIDPASEAETLVWVHGFLTALTKRIEAQIPALSSCRTNDLPAVKDPRSIEDKLNELRRGSSGGDADAAGVRARRRPAPTGRS